MFTHEKLLRLNAHLTVAGECWLWSGSLDGHGYGHVRVMGKLKKVHRFVYETLHAPTTQHIHHKCHVQSCCRPEHIEPVDPVEHGKMHGGEPRISVPICATHGTAKVLQSDGARRKSLKCRECRAENQRRRRAKRAC